MQTSISVNEGAQGAAMPTPLFPYNADAVLRFSGHAMLLADLVSLLAAFMLAGVSAWAINIYLLDDSFQKLLSQGSAAQFILFTALGCTGLLWLDQQGHYRMRLPFWEMAGHVVTLTLVGLLLSGFLQYAAKHEFSRLWLGLGWLFFAGLLFAGRGLARRLLQRAGRWQVPVLLLGNGRTADGIIRALQADAGMGFSVAACVPAAQLAQVHHVADWHRLLQQHAAGYVLIALEGAELQTHQNALRALSRAHIAFSVAPPWLGLPGASMTPHGFFTHDAVILHNINRLALPLPRLLKRTFDIVTAGALVAVSLLPLLVLAFFIRRDGGPALFRQVRLGRRGKPFMCYKLRSMVVDAPTTLSKYLTVNPEAAAEWNAFQKLKHDPRITSLGRVIRSFSLDELPQLWNVLKGDMSLVGPRPILRDQQHLYGDDFAYYAAVRPGITGPWQVSGRNMLSFDERVQLEGWYTRNWSLWMDIVVLLKTPRAVWSSDQTS